MRPDLRIRLSRVVVRLDALEKVRREALFGKDWRKDFKAFVDRFVKFALKAKDRALVKFADRLINYPSYMRNVDPVEFANHFLRNTKPKLMGYRGKVSADRIAQSILGGIASKVRSMLDVDPKFAQFASGFFSDASHASVS